MKKAWSRKAVSAGLILLILVGSLVIAAVLVGRRPPPETQEENSPPLLVQTSVLQREAVTERVVVYGEVHSSRRVELRSELAARVVECHPELEVGTAIQEGEFLLRLDAQRVQQQLASQRALLAATEAQLSDLDLSREGQSRELAQTQVLLELAERELQRWQQLDGASSPSPSELDVQRGLVESQRSVRERLATELARYPARREALREQIVSQRSSVEQAQLDVANTEFRAPFAGQLSAVNVELGEFVTVGTPLLQLVSLEGLEARVQIPASLSGGVEVGAAAAVGVEGGAQAIPARVLRMAPEADRETRSVATTLLLAETSATEENGPSSSATESPNGSVSHSSVSHSARPLRPGMFVAGWVQGRTFQHALTVPRDAVIDGAVFVLESGRARRIVPRFGERLADRVLILEAPKSDVGSGGLEGERLILSNLELLFDGLRVRDE